MSLRFKGENLIDENGQVFNVSFEELVTECLASSYTSLSISGIIVEAVKEVTGLDCMKYRCRESNLFCKLETAILEDSRYQEEKNEIVRKRRVELDFVQQCKAANPEIFIPENTRWHR